MVLAFYVCFFFFKQKTAYEMRISDWSSDVCSSDLLTERGARTGSAFGTCLPRLSPHPVEYSRARPGRDAPRSWQAGGFRPNSYSNSRMSHPRSEESRVGKECVSTFRSRWSPYHSNKQPAKTTMTYRKLNTKD